MEGVVRVVKLLQVSLNLKERNERRDQTSNISKFLSADTCKLTSSHTSHKYNFLRNPIRGLEALTGQGERSRSRFVENNAAEPQFCSNSGVKQMNNTDRNQLKTTGQTCLYQVYPVCKRHNGWIVLYYKSGLCECSFSLGSFKATNTPKDSTDVSPVQI